MGYKGEWLLYEAGDDIDEMQHRSSSEEMRFWLAVAEGDVEAVKENCRRERFVASDGVGILSKILLQI